jgi:hypothetical protein
MPRCAKKLILSAFVLCVAAAVFSGTAAAAVANLPDGFLIGDQDGVRMDAGGYYYMDCQNLLPGQVIHKTLSIQNLPTGSRAPEDNTPFTLSMTAEPLESSGPVDLLDTALVMELDGVTIYEGSVRGDGSPDMRERPLPLGVYAVGDTKTLAITLTVDPDMPPDAKASRADFRWRFYASRERDGGGGGGNGGNGNPVDPGNPGDPGGDVGGGDAGDGSGDSDFGDPGSGGDVPKTGLPESYWIYLIPIGATAAFSLFLILKKRKRDRDRQTE